jgi:hypothetical protein
MLLMVFSSLAFAQNKYLVILGGGGEPRGEGTIFDQNLKLMGQFARAHPEYKVDVKFNGGHLKTERIIQEQFKSFTPDHQFTQENFEKTILKYEKMIESGEIKSGDNLLLNIDSHGSVQDGKTHRISTVGEKITDYNVLGGKTVSLDRLKKLTELAEKKGVNLGIIDLSCHSGNTLSLANRKTCVITGAGSEHYGIAGLSERFFSNDFARNLSHSSNLEEAFLAARAKRIDITFPMISSPAGIETQKILYESLTPYLHYYTIMPDKFIDFMEEDLLKGKECRVENGFQQLNLEIEKLLKASTDFTSQTALNELKDALRKYHNYILDIKLKMQEAGFGIMKKKHEFCSTIPADPKNKILEGKECINYYTMEQLLQLDFKMVLGYYEKSLNDPTLDASTKAKNKAIIECYKKAEEWKKFIISKNPNYLLIADFWNKFPSLSSQTRALADGVIHAEEQVYNLIYKRSKTEASNPCRNFRL